MLRFFLPALLLLATSAANLVHANQGGMMVEVFAHGTLEKLQLAHGSYVEDYDQLDLRLRRMSTSWVWYDGLCFATNYMDGYVITSWATDYVPFTQVNCMVYNGTTTKLKHYLKRPVLNLVISPASLTEGGLATGTITLKNEAGANVTIMNAMTINLSSNNTARATVPASVVIPMQTASANFSLSAVNNAVQDGNAVVTVSATAGTWGSISTTVTVVDND